MLGVRVGRRESRSTSPVQVTYLGSFVETKSDWALSIFVNEESFR